MVIHTRCRTGRGAVAADRGEVSGGPVQPKGVVAGVAAERGTGRLTQIGDAIGIRDGELGGLLEAALRLRRETTQEQQPGESPGQVGRIGAPVGRVTTTSSERDP